MKTIVVSGARSKIGKTALARALCALLPGAVHIKLGHGRPKRDAGNVFYPAGTPYARIAGEHAAAPFLVIESNRILDEHRPDLAIYLPADSPKPTAAAARRRADLVRGRPAPSAAAGLIARRLAVPRETAEAIVRLAGAGFNAETAPGAERSSGNV